MRVSEHQPLESEQGVATAHDAGLLSIIVPVFNEDEVIPEFHSRLTKVLETISLNWEVVYVNDGSTDRTDTALTVLRESDQRVAVIQLSRNFGKEIAMTAGLDVVSGDAVVIIDADLQDPPELIPELVRLWREEGYDNVYAQRTDRLGETWFKKSTAHLFYRAMTFFGETTLPTDVGDYRLLSRKAVGALKSLRERHRFMKGLFAWIGYPSIAVPYQRDPRFAGVTKWNYFKLWNLAIEGFTSYSTTPLRLSGFVGMLLALAALGFGSFIIVKKLIYGDPVPGYPSLMVVVSFLGGIQLLSLGVMGEYLARIFNETKSRPLYFIKEYHPSKNAENKDGGHEC